jgi:hypothetical protein
MYNLSTGSNNMQILPKIQPSFFKAIFFNHAIFFYFFLFHVLSRKSKGHKLRIVTKKGLQNKHKNLESREYNLFDLESWSINNYKRIKKEFKWLS